MKIKVDPHAAVPIYRQMIAAIVSAIESGEIDPGERLPSIRQLSAELNINPNTTAKAYRELELRGFVESKAGSGSFVLARDEKARIAEKKARMQIVYDKMLGEAKALRIDEQDFLEFLRLRAGS